MITSNASGSTFSVYETIPGTFQVTATVTFQPESNKQHTVPQGGPYTVTVTVPPPDGTTPLTQVPAPANGLINVGGTVDTPFQITCQGQTVGYLPGTAIVQEQISNVVLIQGSSKSATNWLPVNNSNLQFYWSGSIIHDKRTVSDDIATANDPVSISYQQANVGQAYLKCTQKLQILIINGCGAYLPPIALGTYTITMFKGPNGTYKITVQ